MSKCLFLTGIPCSGKTTIAKELMKYYPRVQLLDGDEIRDTPISAGAGFTPEDRKRHLLRVGYLAKMFVDQGIWTICSFVSPLKEVRNEIRSMFKEGDFLEIYVDPGIEECKKRDVKGMYAKAIKGEIKNFTGISAPYEAPDNPELVIDTSKESETVEVSAARILEIASPFDDPVSIFIGRWNGVYHNGHDHIVHEPLKKGRRVLMLIRNVEPDEKNPMTASEVKEMLDFRFQDDSRVETMIIPDVKSVEYGRGVGYEVNEIKVDKKIAGISGTECRKLIAEGNDSWKEFVPGRIVEFLENKISVK